MRSKLSSTSYLISMNSCIHLLDLFDYVLKIVFAELVCAVFVCLILCMPCLCLFDVVVIVFEWGLFYVVFANVFCFVIVSFVLLLSRIRCVKVLFLCFARLLRLLLCLSLLYFWCLIMMVVYIVNSSVVLDSIAF